MDHSERRRSPKPWSGSPSFVAPALYNFFPWFVRFRTWPSGIDRSLRQRWPFISIEPSVPSQLWRSDELAKLEAQKLCIPFDGSEFQEPGGRLGEYLFKLKLIIVFTKIAKHEREIAKHERGIETSFHYRRQ